MKSLLDYLAGLTTDELKTLLSDGGTVISYATSADGVSWQYHSDVLKPGDSGWDRCYAGAPSVIRNSDGSFNMWYTGGEIDLSAARGLLSDLAKLSTGEISTLMGKTGLPGYTGVYPVCQRYKG